MGREAWDGFEKLTGLVGMLDFRCLFHPESNSFLGCFTLVLNVPGCNLTSIPSQFSQLSSLKALVAIHNKLTELDDSVVSHWSLLNSLSKHSFDPLDNCPPI